MGILSVKQSQYILVSQDWQELVGYSCSSLYALRVNDKYVN